jgi:hypothetical protein
MIQLYGPNGESRGEEKITTTTQDLIKNLGPIALAAGGSALASSLLGPAGVVGSDLAGLSGIPAGTGALTAAEAAALYGTVGSDLAGLSGIPAGTAALTAAEQAALYGTAGAGAANLLAPAVTAGGAAAGGAATNLLAPAVTAAGGALTGSTLASLAVPAALAVTGLVGADAAKSAAATQADSAKQANELLYKMYQEQKGLQEPFRGAGVTAQNRLLDLLGLSKNTGAQGFGQYAKDFGMSDFTADPGYAFRLSEGQKALERNAAARGGLISGGALKAATRYGQDMGSQEYQSAFNRYQTNRANQLAPLGSLLSTGQAAASNQSAAAGNYGTQAGGNITGAGAATAAGQVGSTNALTNALSSYLNYSSGQNLADAIRKSTYGG